MRHVCCACTPSVCTTSVVAMLLATAVALAFSIVSTLQEVEQCITTASAAVPCDVTAFDVDGDGAYTFSDLSIFVAVAQDAQANDTVAHALVVLARLCRCGDFDEDNDTDADDARALVAMDYGDDCDAARFALSLIHI